MTRQSSSSEPKTRRRAKAADHPEDFYPTPSWCVRALQAALVLPGGRWLEPAAGDGAIVRTFAHRVDIEWDLVELRPEAAGALALLPFAGGYPDCPRDYLNRAHNWHSRYPVAITNPPFSKALRFVGKMLKEAHIVVCLLRLAFLESEERNPFLQRHSPDVYVLPRRPSFSEDGTDNSAYAWFVWYADRPEGTPGTLRVLPLNAGQLELGGTR